MGASCCPSIASFPWCHIVRFASNSNSLPLLSKNCVFSTKFEKFCSFIWKKRNFWGELSFQLKIFFNWRLQASQMLHVGKSSPTSKRVLLWGHSCPCHVRSTVELFDSLPIPNLNFNLDHNLNFLYKIHSNSPKLKFK